MEHGPVHLRCSCLEEFPQYLGVIGKGSIIRECETANCIIAHGTKRRKMFMVAGVRTSDVFDAIRRKIRKFRFDSDLFLKYYLVCLV